MLYVFDSAIAARRGDVHWEEQPIAGKLGVEIIEHDPRIHDDRARIPVHRVNAIQVFAGIDHHGPTYCLARLGRTGTSGKHGHPLFGRDLDRMQHIGYGARDDHADGLDLVDRCIGAVETAREPVETDFTFDCALEATRQLGVTNAGAASHGLPVGQIMIKLTCTRWQFLLGVNPVPTGSS